MTIEGSSIGSDIDHQAPHSERDERFFRMLRKLPPEATEFITTLSNVFIEPDELQKFRADPKNVVNLGGELKSLGLTKRQVGQIIRFFNLKPAISRRSRG